MAGNKGEITPQLLTLIQKYLSGVQFKVSGVVSGSKVMLVDSSGNELTSVDISALSVGNAYIGKPTNGDFVTAYDCTAGIAISGLPSDITAIASEDIESVRQINTSGHVVDTYSRDDANMNVTGGVLTVTDAVFAASDTFVVATNIPRPGGGGAGGVEPDYKIGSWDGTVTFATTTTVTLAGDYPTITYNSQVLYIKFTDDTLHTSDKFTNGQSGVTIEHSGGTLTIYGAGTPFASTNDYEVGISATPIGMDIDGNAILTKEQVTDFGHNIDSEHLDDSNLGITGNTGTYERTLIPSSSYNHMSCTYLLTADNTGNKVGLKIYASNNPDISLPNSTTAIVTSDAIPNVSNDVLGAAGGVNVSGGSLCDFFVIDSDTQFENYVIERKYTAVTAGTVGNAADLFIKKYY